MTLRFKQIEWIKRDVWVAETPASDLKRITIFFDEGKYWASWDLTLPGTTDLAALKRAGQQWHEQWLRQWVEPEPDPWEDRMGGQFTQEEINRAQRGGEGW
jgi:hypothetical protein